MRLRQRAKGAQHGESVDADPDLSPVIINKPQQPHRLAAVLELAHDEIGAVAGSVDDDAAAGLPFAE